MKVTLGMLPPIHENHAQWESSSQEARIEGFISSDVPSDFHAVRLEHKMKTAQPRATSRPQPMQQQQQPQQTAVKVWKNFCYRASMVCGALALPSFAFLAFGVVGLAVPAVLFLTCVFFAVLAGKLTPEIEAAREQRAAQNAMYDPR